MARRIYFDGFNLARPQGTGVATYGRTLATLAGVLGHEVGIVYGAANLPAQARSTAELALRERRVGFSLDPRATLADRIDLARCRNPIRPVPLLVCGDSPALVPGQRYAFAGRNLFNNARRYFARTGRFVELQFDEPPDILHLTYPLPVRAPQARNIYTIHDVVSLRLPFAMGDDKPTTLSLLRQIGETADRIVTVSQASKRDIVDLVGIDPSRIAVTSQAVDIPAELIGDAPPQTARRFGFQPGSYLLFFGALEPKKNVARLIEAYLLASPGIPLVVVSRGGWSNRRETRLIAENRDRIRHIENLDRAALIDMIRGARAVLFPSLYEGFGLPVLEAMMLRTPVVTSRAGALPEVAGDAALYVDPYDVADIARGIATISRDEPLRAELRERGAAQAANFSIVRYREVISELYASLE